MQYAVDTLKDKIYVLTNEHLHVLKHDGWYKSAEEQRIEEEKIKELTEAVSVLEKHRSKKYDTRLKWFLCWAQKIFFVISKVWK